MEIASFADIMIQYGIFGALFVSLLVYVMRQNEKREKEYQQTIKALSESIYCAAVEGNKMIQGVDSDIGVIYSNVHEIKNDVGEIKKDIGKIKISIHSISGG